MDIRHYTVALEVDPANQSIDGYAEIDLRLSSPTNLLLLDLWHGLTVRQVEVNGKKEKFSHSRNDLLTIPGAKPYAAGPIKIKVTYGNSKEALNSTIDRTRRRLTICLRFLISYP